MSYWMVDLRDRVAQRVTHDADEPMYDGRFFKVEAESAKEAINKAMRIKAQKAYESKIADYKKLWADNPLTEGEKQQFGETIAALDELLNGAFCEEPIIQGARDLIAGVLGEEE